MVKIRKIEHHWFPLIPLGTKFQLKMTIFIFLTRFTQKGFFWSKTEKINTSYFLHNSAYSNYLFFGSNLQKKVFPVKNWKIWHCHWIPHIQISLLVPNFCFNWQFWFFWRDLFKKDFSGLKQEKWTPHNFYIILHIQISLVWNFSSNWQFWFFGPNLPKKVFPVKNRKSEHHHGILHIWISLGTKFQLKTHNFEFLDQRLESLKSVNT